MSLRMRKDFNFLAVDSWRLRIGLLLVRVLNLISPTVTDTVLRRNVMCKQVVSGDQRLNLKLLSFDAVGTGRPRGACGD